MSALNSHALAKVWWRGSLASLITATLFLYVFIGGAQAAQKPLGCDKVSAPTLEALTLGEPSNLHFFEQNLLYYRCSKYDADVAAVLNDALRWVEERAPQVAKPAIVLDIDETSLSNWDQIYTDDYGYIPKGPCDLRKKGFACGMRAWNMSARAPALLPTLQLFDAAKCLHVATVCTKAAVFFVTGRGPSERSWTELNLRRAGYVDWDGLYMRNGGKSVEEFKTGARLAIERRGYTIIANVGDQESDLVGGHSERTFKVPNPFYFIP